MFDFESSGLNPQTHNPLTMSGVILNQDLTILDKISLKIKPNDGNYIVQPEAMAVNKINLLQHHEQAITESDAGRKLREFLFRNSDMGSTKLIPCGHFIGELDIPFAKRLIGPYEWGKLTVYRVIDTGTISQFLILAGKLPESAGGGLGKLCSHFGIDASGVHNADVDVELTRQLLQKLLELTKSSA